jgi:hypothetical protein
VALSIPLGSFQIFSKNPEIFANGFFQQCRWLVSLTLVNSFSALLLTPAINSNSHEKKPPSTIPNTRFKGVIVTGNKFIAGAIVIGDKFIAGINDTTTPGSLKIRDKD